MSDLGHQNDLAFGRGFTVRIITIGGLFFLYIPIIILIIFSFNASRFSSQWGGFSLKWYVTMIQDGALWSAIRNTLIIAISNAVLSTILGTLAALALSRHRYRFSGLYHKVLHMPIIIPDIVQAVSLLMLFVFFNFTLGLVSVILAHASFSISFVALVVMARLAGFDNRLEEAAMDLGANRWQVFQKVILPNIFPGILAGALLAFTLSIDDFVITFFTTGVGSTTLPLKIYSMIKFGITPEINAISTLLVVFSIAAVSAIHFFEKNPKTGGKAHVKNIT
ncbi:MAG: ABC transporter permease [Candidatus Marinimicrobia bacterium]|nr:ABC transporter permease [Candidatus Neomarinimicrobiota bacterium]